MGKEQFFLDMISGRKKGPLPQVARAGLLGLSYLYGRIVAKRNGQFDRGTGIDTVGVPVMSVGNIIVGGTGKTPFVAYAAQYMLERGLFPVILMRGYKAKDNRKSLIVSDGRKVLLSAEESGDEAYLLAKKLPGCGLVIGRSRKESARIACEALGAQVLILDDGFQHRQLGRDVDVVLIDSTNPFGFGHVLPRGLLREPLEGLERANVVVLTKSNQVTEGEKEAIYEGLRPYVGDRLICETVHGPQELLSVDQWLDGRCPQGTKRPSPEKVYAVSAIGNPASFVRTLEEKGLTVVGQKVYGDHYAFQHQDIQDMMEGARQAGAEALVMTEKDAVKLAPKLALLPVDSTLPFYILPIAIVVTQGERDFRNLLDNLVASMEKSL